MRDYIYRHPYTEGPGEAFLGFEQVLLREKEARPVPSATKWRLLTETLTTFDMQAHSSSLSSAFLPGYPVNVQRIQYLEDSPSIFRWEEVQNTYQLRDVSGAGLFAPGGVFIDHTRALYSWGETNGTVNVVLGTKDVQTGRDDFGRETSTSTLWSDGRFETRTTAYYDESDGRWAQWFANRLVSLPRAVATLSVDNLPSGSDAGMPRGLLKT